MIPLHLCSCASLPGSRRIHMETQVYQEQTAAAIALFLLSYIDLPLTLCDINVVGGSLDAVNAGPTDAEPLCYSGWP